jgi:uncharacterized membrane protein YdjX (TVP38/TMEM64 family)
VITIYVVTALVEVVSAFVPATPMEPYLVGVVATTDHAPLLLGVAAAAGQATGKLLLFLAARGTIRSGRLRRWLDQRIGKRTNKPGGVASGKPRCAWLARRAALLVALLDRPALTAPIVFLSAVSSLPPLLVTSVYAARTRISARTFGAVCLVGRSIRFVTIAFVPHLIGI